jgi:hypothetical protein
MTALLCAYSQVSSTCSGEGCTVSEPIYACIPSGDPIQCDHNVLCGADCADACCVFANDQVADIFIRHSFE